jgi:hypothetical protein
MILFSSGYSSEANAKFLGPAKAFCEFDLNGKHYVGTQYVTNIIGPDGALQYGCRAGLVFSGGRPKIGDLGGGLPTSAIGP